MSSPGPTTRASRLTAITAGVALIATLLVVQMWLLSVALEAFLAGHRETALPAAIVSGVLFAGAAGLYWLIERVDRRGRT